MKHTPYTPELANKLQAKGVPLSTIDVWKHRGKVPNRAIECKQYGRWTGKEFEWTRKVLTHPLIVRAKAGFARHNGKVKSVRKDDYTMLKGLINSLASQVQAAQKDKKAESIIEVLDNPVLRRLTLLKELGEKKGKQIDTRLRKGMGFKEGEAKEILKLLMNLMRELK